MGNLGRATQERIPTYGPDNKTLRLWRVFVAFLGHFVIVFVSTVHSLLMLQNV
jgi:hypothetical protein